MIWILRRRSFVVNSALTACLLLPAGASAASIDRGFNLTVPAPGSSLPLPPPPPSAVPPPRYQPAPLPNRDVELAPPRASNEPSLAPGLFTRKDEYRGDGFSKGSTSQAEQEKRVKPGAGFNLRLPFSPN